MGISRFSGNDGALQDVRISLYMLPGMEDFPPRRAAARGSRQGRRGKTPPLAPGAQNSSVSKTDEFWPRGVV